MSQAVTILILLTSAVFAVAIARRLGLPSLIAYLAVGVALGPHGFKLFHEDTTVQHLAEFGVVFLMFSIGLEFSLQRLRTMRSLVFGLGAGQVLITLLGTILVTLYFYGQEWRVGFAVGAACAMSSTAIVAKLLTERMELHTQAGRQTMGVLIFQDLAVVPFLVFIPALGSHPETLLVEMTKALAIAGGMLLFIIAIGQWLMRKWFSLVARTRSEELFMLNVLFVVIGLSMATAWAGLSLALGAFVGGVLIAETIYRHQVEADIRPFRDVLLGLFFVTIGMMLDMGFVIQNLPLVFLALFLLVVAKAGIVLIITLAMKTPLHVALRTAFQVAQAGEFGFVLLELSRQNRLLPEDVFQVTMAAMLLSMFIAPFIIHRMAGIGGILGRSAWMHSVKAVHEVATKSMGLEGHVILCGFGRSGQNIAQFLKQEAIPYLALDLDETRIRQAVRAGEKVVFGNAERAEVLAAAGINRARAVILTYADAASSEKVLLQVRKMRPDVPVVVRAEDESRIHRLKDAGASEVVPEVQEGSLMMAVQTLTQLGVPMERAMGYARAARAERYSSLREYYQGETEKR
jgi:CPA2 family monovalent cation:H+ antiporter-2